MEIVILRSPVKAARLRTLGRARDGVLRLAVDVTREVVAAGGEFHADCEEALLEDGSLGEHVWGADLDPETGTLRFQALINIKPQQGSRTMSVEDPSVQARIEDAAGKLLFITDTATFVLQDGATTPPLDLSLVAVGK